MWILIDAASESGLKRRSEVTRFFNYFPTNVEPYFGCEDPRAKQTKQTVIDNWRALGCNGRMKTPRFILALVALIFVLAPQRPTTTFARPYKGYNARLISPAPGQVLKPGQVVRIQWAAHFPGVDLTMCEAEILLSLDGGRTIYMRLTESRNPTVQYFDWTVPNTPTNEAVLDIRFGCLNIYPETPSVQFQSAFVISPTPPN